MLSKPLSRPPSLPPHAHLFAAAATALAPQGHPHYPHRRSHVSRRRLQDGCKGLSHLVASGTGSLLQRSQNKRRRCQRDRPLAKHDTRRQRPSPRRGSGLVQDPPPGRRTAQIAAPATPSPTRRRRPAMTEAGAPTPNGPGCRCRCWQANRCRGVDNRRMAWAVDTGKPTAAASSTAAGDPTAGDPCAIASPPPSSRPPPLLPLPLPSTPTGTAAYVCTGRS